jgi:holo-[acyl-carrier protein] synthase
VNLALGVDLVEVRRIADAFERHPGRFISRHFTRREDRSCKGDPRRLAVRWAAKEATAKALGTGIGPIGWHEIELVTDGDGAPSIVLSGKAQLKAAAAGLDQWSVTLSHTEDHAIAVVAAIGLGAEEIPGKPSEVSTSGG